MDWRQALAILGTAIASGLATHFGGSAVQAPRVTGQECATMLMDVARACSCPESREEEVP